MYIGREQQKKGTVLRKSQLLLFGAELPRGHGYKGKLASKLSQLYDEITGRSPRKRQAKLTRSTETPSTKRVETVETISKMSIGIVGDNSFAILLAKRLLRKKYTVIALNSELVSSIQSDPNFVRRREEGGVDCLHHAPLLPRFLQMVGMIFVVVCFVCFM